MRIISFSKLLQVESAKLGWLFVVVFVAAARVGDTCLGGSSSCFSREFCGKRVWVRGLRSMQEFVVQEGQGLANG